MIACDEHAAHLDDLERSLMLRNGGALYPEKSRRLGGESEDFEKEAFAAAANVGMLGLLDVSSAVMTLMASRACKTPITPTTGPTIPPSPHVTTLSAGGGFGKMQR